VCVFLCVCVCVCVCVCECDGVCMCVSQYMVGLGALLSHISTNSNYMLAAN